MTTIYSYFVRGEKHAAMCATSMESVRRVDPFARFVIWTDDGTGIPGGREKMAVHSFEGGMPIMLANLEAQCRTLTSVAFQGERVVFLDADILLLDQLPWGEEDLIVTWRDRVGLDEEGNPVVGLAVTMPYNYGVIGTHAGAASIESFIWMRERIRRMNPRLLNWYGNQVALAALCGPRPQDGAAQETRHIPWLPTQHGCAVRITKLPGDRWNYTPKMVGERTHGTRSILHFKGGARALMESYAKKLGLAWHLEKKAAA